MKKIRVKAASKEYPVFIGKKIFPSLHKLMEEYKINKNVFVVVDKNVLAAHQEKIGSFLSKKFGKLTSLVFDSSEKNKSSRSVERIYNALIKNNYGRDSVVIAIGGGITGDIVGFAASTFGRGVQFIQVPTTLLAAVDSSVGGKTGINFGSTKNLIGSFYQPDFVLIDTDFLQTLPEEEVICGAGEVIKYAFLSDPKLFDLFSKELKNLVKLKPAVTADTIETCVHFKASVVESDETESGLRKILNLGHTFAHAFEVEQDYKIKHGQAVAIGLVCALYLSNRLGFINSEKLEKYLRLPLALQDKIHLDSCNVETIFNIMLRDKKSREGKIKFVLLTEPGKLLIDVEASREQVIGAIEDGVSCFI
jgi:3-dehydroquinate synthase